GPFVFRMRDLRRAQDHDFPQRARRPAVVPDRVGEFGPRGRERRMIAERVVKVDRLAPQFVEPLLQGGFELRGGYALHADSMPGPDLRRDNGACRKKIYGATTVAPGRISLLNRTGARTPASSTRFTAGCSSGNRSSCRATPAPNGSRQSPGWTPAAGSRSSTRYRKSCARRPAGKWWRCRA